MDPPRSWHTDASLTPRNHTFCAHRVGAQEDEGYADA